MTTQTVTASGLNHSVVMAELMDLYSMARGVYLMTKDEGDGLAGVLSHKLADEIFALHNRIDRDSVSQGNA